MRQYHRAEISPWSHWITKVALFPSVLPAGQIHSDFFPTADVSRPLKTFHLPYGTPPPAFVYFSPIADADRPRRVPRSPAHNTSPKLHSFVPPATLVKDHVICNQECESKVRHNAPGGEKQNKRLQLPKLVGKVQVPQPSPSHQNCLLPNSHRHQAQETYPGSASWTAYCHRLKRGNIGLVYMCKHNTCFLYTIWLLYTSGLVNLQAKSILPSLCRWPASPQ